MAAEDNGAGDRQAHNAIRAAGVAAASSAAVLAARHALKRSPGSGSRPGLGAAVSAGLESAWNAARDVLLPTLEETATAAGRYVAENAPEPVRETLLPRFLEGFHEARERVEADRAESERDKTKTTGGER